MPCYWVLLASSWPWVLLSALGLVSCAAATLHLQEDGAHTALSLFLGLFCERQFCPGTYIDCKSPTAQAAGGVKEKRKHTTSASASQKDKIKMCSVLLRSEDLLSLRNDTDLAKRSAKKLNVPN